MIDMITTVKEFNEKYKGILEFEDKRATEEKYNKSFMVWYCKDKKPGDEVFMIALQTKATPNPLSKAILIFNDDFYSFKHEVVLDAYGVIVADFKYNANNVTVQRIKVYGGKEEIPTEYKNEWTSMPAFTGLEKITKEIDALIKADTKSDIPDKISDIPEEDGLNELSAGLAGIVEKMDALVKANKKSDV